MSLLRHAEKPSKKHQEINFFHCHPIFNQIQRLNIGKLDTITFTKQL